MSQSRRTGLAGHEQDVGEAELEASDAELGIGEDAEAPASEVDPAAADRIAEVMRDPVIAAAVEELVQRQIAERLAQAGQPQSIAVAAPADDHFMAGMRELGKMIADSINRSTSATVEQMPGHVKPIPVDEVEARAAAFVEMTALVREATRDFLKLVDDGELEDAERMRPIYLLEEDAFLDDTVYLAGTKLQWFRRPGTYMRPQNGVAKKISEAMWRYIGGKSGPSPEQLAEQAGMMRRPRAGGVDLPELPPMLSDDAGPTLRAQQIGTEIQPMGPDRTLGTIVREMKGGLGIGPTTGPRLVGQFA